MTTIRPSLIERRPRIGEGRYELAHELASGGMATVYLARDLRGARDGRESLVAVKCCHPHLREDDEFVAMFLDEARIVSELHHPNVVRTLDWGEDETWSLFIVMEFVDGFSLQQVLRACKHRGAKMPVGVAMRVMIDTLRGLHAAHAHQGRNIVHRDVSPQNVMVGIDGVARIMDFGIARAEGRIAQTRAGSIKGKFAYMPPEQHGLLSDLHPEVTARADVFAAAVVLWEALAGERLFSRDSDAQTVRAAVECQVPPLAGRIDGATAALDGALATAIQRDPAMRFESARSFATALELSGAPIATTREVQSWLCALLAGHIEKRQALLRSILAPGSSGDSASGSRVDSTQQTVALPEDELPPQAPPFRTSVRPPPDPAHARRSQVPALLLALVTIAASALVAAIVVRAHRPPPVARDARPLPVERPVFDPRPPEPVASPPAATTDEPTTTVRKQLPDAGSQRASRPVRRRRAVPRTTGPYLPNSL